MMASKLNYHISLLLLVMSLLFSLSSSSAISIWIALEMNLLSFISLCFNSTNVFWEVIPKYFIVQSISSAGILLILVVSSSGFNFGMKLVLLFFIMLKLGGWPFVSWFVSLSKLMNKDIFFLFLTLQKLIPLYLLYVLSLKNDLTLILTINAIFSSYMVISSNTPNILLAYSSVFSLSWMFLAIVNFSTMFAFLLVYMCTLWPVAYLLSGGMFLTNKNFMPLSFNEIFIFSMMFFALMGMPPSLPFLLKLVIISLAKMYLNIFLSLILLLLAAPFIYAYSSLMMESLSMKKLNILYTPVSSLTLLMVCLIIWVGPLMIMYFLEDSMYITL